MNAYQVCPEFKIFVESDIERYRAETFETKEPETIAWIQEFIKDRETFLDVGANIGIYSLYMAALHKETFTIAFEPFLPNLIRLEENIKLNGLENIRAFHAGFSNQTRMVNFYSPKIETGTSGGQVGTTIGEDGKKFNYLSVQQIPCYRMDDFFYIFKIPAPNHIKIDVDGQEEQVIIGGLNCISSYYCKSVMVERNQGFDRNKLVDAMGKMGFTEDNKFNKMENHSRVRREKEGILAENILFVRK